MSLHNIGYKYWIAEEPFSSIQGEGIMTGIPMLFIRFSGCNLRCVFCDTDYSWQKGTETTLDKLMTAVFKYNGRWICLTGGEPLLWNLDGLVEYIGSLGKHVTIETNGTLHPTTLVKFHISLWSVSPKMTNSGRSTQDVAKQMESVAKFISYRKTQLKFVCRKEEDIMEALAFIETIEREFKVSLQEIPVIFQPMAVIGENVQSNLDTLRVLWKFLQNIQGQYPYNLRIMPQLHRLLYGSRRQV